MLEFLGIFATLVAANLVAFAIIATAIAFNDKMHRRHSK